MACIIRMVSSCVFRCVSELLIVVMALIVQSVKEQGWQNQLDLFQSLLAKWQDWVPGTYKAESAQL